MKFITIFFISFFSIIICKAQLDTEFWFAAPEVTEHGAGYLDRPIKLIITATNLNANVQISLPANNSVSPISISIPTNTTTIVDITYLINEIETTPPNTILKTGIRIVSDNPVTVYYNVETGGPLGNGNSPEIFVLKGSNALGTKFVIPSQNFVANDYAYSPKPTNSFDIIATEDNTTVTIRGSKDMIGRPLAQGSFNVTLNKGETFSNAAVTNVASQHLAGSFVDADKPIAITMKDDLLSGNIFGGNCGDLTGDQIVPIDILGNSYIAMPTYLSHPGDQLFITAIENNTEIYFGSAVTPATILQSGQTYQRVVPQDGIFLHSNNKIAVWQLAGHGCELGATLLPTIECTGSFQVTYVRNSNYLLKLNLLIEAGHENNFTINNQPLSSSFFYPIPETNNQWLLAKIDLPISEYPKYGFITVKNSSAKFHMATIDINSGGTSYGYYSDYSVGYRLDRNMDTLFCVGDTIKLNVLNTGNVPVSWTGPNGFNSNVANPIIPSAQVNHTGWYQFSTVTSGCNFFDSVYIKVIESDPISLNVIDSNYCIGDTIRISADINESVIWQISSPYNSISNNIIELALKDTVWISINTVNITNCDRSNSIMIPALPKPKINLIVENKSVPCTHPIVNLQANGANYYEWLNHNKELIGNGNALNYTVNKNGFIYIIGSDENKICKAVDSVYINMMDIPNFFIPNAFSPNGDGLNDLFGAEIHCELRDFSLSIYNRFGERVFMSNDVNARWDGIYNDKVCDVGVYFYFLSYKPKWNDYNNISVKGEVHLLR